MPLDLLPLFPLKMVALPGAAVPLHIFEERYKEMIGIAMEHQSEFGIVLAPEQGVANVGCSVVVDKVLQRYDDGRLDIVCVGKRRFSIETLDTEKPYLRGRVRFFEDEEGVVPEELAALQDETYAAWKEIGKRVAAGNLPEIDARDPHLSFLLGQAVADLNTRQILLQMRSEMARLDHLLHFFRDFEGRQTRLREMKNLAPTNGHAKRAGSNGHH